MFALLRPPGARNERDFLARCIHCGRCAEVCPYGSIRMAGGFGVMRNTPHIRPRAIPCWLCMKCPPVCPSGALRPVQAMQEADMGMAVLLKSKCHNWVGEVLCRTCYDKCPLRGTAIILEGGDIPAVADSCVGCGVCEHVCPVDAIIVRPGTRAKPKAQATTPAGHVPQSGPTPLSATGAGTSADTGAGTSASISTHTGAGTASPREKQS